MFQKTLARFKGLRPPVRSLVFLFWIFTFTGSVTGIFTQIFLYERFTSVFFNVVASMLFNTGTMVGFCVFGYLASRWRRNIKQGFAASFVVMTLGFIVLISGTSMIAACIAMTFLGIGNGLFWLTVHTFELSQTKDEERDFYSSLLSAGSQVFSFLGPALATLLIWISGMVFHIGNLTLLFIITPVFYLLGFFCFSALADYRPAPIRLADLWHFLSNRKNQIAQIYLSGGAFHDILQNIVPSLVVLFILGSALNVGIFSTLLGLFSAVCVLMVAHHRTSENRLLIFGIMTLIMVLTTVWFGAVFTFIALVVYTIIESIVAPLLRVSIHVTDLKTMESMGRENSDFYATMILRDLSLWFWRMLIGVIFLGIITLLHSEKEMLVAGLYLLAFSSALTFIGARLLLKTNL
ncbi:MAG: MFS transporter [Patescibacteria group bacterium]